MRLCRFTKGELSAHNRIEGPALQAGRQRCVDAAHLALAGVPKGHAEDACFPRHSVAWIDLHVAAAADNDDAATSCQGRQIAAQVNVGQHLKDDVHTPVVG